MASLLSSSLGYGLHRSVDNTCPVLGSLSFSPVGTIIHRRKWVSIFLRTGRELCIGTPRASHNHRLAVASVTDLCTSKSAWRTSEEECEKAHSNGSVSFSLCSDATTAEAQACQSRIVRMKWSGYLQVETWIGSRRAALLSISLASLLISNPKESIAEEKQDIQDFSLEPYNDEKEGFTLLRPALWNKVEKAGATLLLEDPTTRGNSIGVVVNPVRISSLKDFGSLDDVADKLIAAERRKPSTNEARLVRTQERQAHGNFPLYQLEYTLDSSRGKKRILSAVTVAARKLYILNIAYVDSPVTPAPAALVEAFQQVLDSFDLLS